MRMKILSITLLLLLPLLLLPPTFGQQQQVQVPSPAANAAMNVTATTTFSTTAIGAPVGNAGSANVLTGTHNIYGYQMIYAPSALGDVCWLQVFDQQVASVTVGTTRPKFAIPILNANSSGGINPNPAISAIPMFNMTSTLTVAAASTPTGNTACVGNGTNLLVIGHFFYR